MKCFQVKLFKYEIRFADFKSYSFVLDSTVDQGRFFPVRPVRILAEYKFTSS